MNAEERQQRLDYVREAVVETFGVVDDEVDKHPLVAKFAEMQLNDPNSDPKRFLETELISVSSIAQLIAELLDIDESRVAPSSRFREDLEADSLDIVELIMAFEEEFGGEIADEDAQGLTTVQDVVEYLNNRMFGRN